MIKSRIEDRMTEAFDGFEPEVQGQWSDLEQQLDAQGTVQDVDMVKRVRSAERFAIGATAVAAGLTLWMAYPLISESTVDTGGQVTTVVINEVEDDELPTEHITGFDSDFGWESGMKMDPEAPVSGSHARLIFPDISARTSNSVKMSVVELDATEDVVEVTRVHLVVEEDLNVIEPTGASPITTLVVEELNEEVNSVTLVSSVKEACEGTEVDFALEEFMDSGSILWNFGDGAFSQERTPSHVFDRPGSYDITVSVRSHDNGFIRTKSIEDMIVVRPKPEASMDWEFGFNKGNGVEVQLVDATERASSSTWVMTDQGLNGSRITILEPGAYPVNLVVSNAYGCQDVAMGSIEIGDRHDAGAPSIFSPNGDGRYDTFLPEAANDVFAPWLFTVFNSAGELVFETNAFDKPWKGELIGGGKARLGARYFWNLEQTNRNGSKRMYSDVVRIDG